MATSLPGTLLASWQPATSDTPRERSMLTARWSCRRAGGVILGPWMVADALMVPRQGPAFHSVRFPGSWRCRYSHSPGSAGAAAARVMPMSGHDRDESQQWLGIFARPAHIHPRSSDVRAQTLCPESPRNIGRD